MIKKWPIYVLMLTSILFPEACNAVVKSSDIQQNLNPKLKYEVTVTVKDAPGPLVPGTIHVHYTAASVGPDPCYPLDAFSGASTRQPEDDADFSLTRVDSNLYKGAIYADYFQDAVYFKGHSPCHWAVNMITATFRGSRTTFDMSADIDWHPSETTYFLKKDYDTPPGNGRPASSTARAGFGWPITDLWTAEVKVVPAAPESPATGQAAERKAKQAIHEIGAENNARKESEVQALATGGTKVLAESFDDINNDNVQDAVVILDPPSGKAKVAAASSRTVVVLTGDASGNLKVAQQNNRIVPCATCNGMSGDPFSFLRTFSNAFAQNAPLDDVRSRLYGFDVFVEGGTQEHWWSRYSFNYSTQQKDWMLYEVYRGIVDIQTDKRREINLTQKDFGTIRFEDFDPARLPQPALP
jgi:hypothetical protein